MQVFTLVGGQATVENGKDQGVVILVLLPPRAAPQVEDACLIVLVDGHGFCKCEGEARFGVGIDEVP